MNQPYESCSHLMSEKASKGRFLKAEKERKRREKSNGCILSFYNGYFGRKKLSDAKGPSGDDVFKNRARYVNNWRVCQTPVYHTHILEKPDLPGTNLFGGIRLSPQANFPMQMSESTASLSLAERWTITEIRRQMLC